MLYADIMFSRTGFNVWILSSSFVYSQDVNNFFDHQINSLKAQLCFLIGIFFSSTSMIISRSQRNKQTGFSISALI